MTTRKTNPVAEGTFQGDLGLLRERLDGREPGVNESGVDLLSDPVGDRGRDRLLEEHPDVEPAGAVAVEDYGLEPEGAQHLDGGEGTSPVEPRVGLLVVRVDID